MTTQCARRYPASALVGMVMLGLLCCSSTAQARNDQELRHQGNRHSESYHSYIYTQAPVRPLDWNEPRHNRCRRTDWGVDYQPQPSYIAGPVRSTHSRVSTAPDDLRDARSPEQLRAIYGDQAEALISRGW